VTTKRGWRKQDGVYGATLGNIPDSRGGAGDDGAEDRAVSFDMNSDAAPIFCGKMQPIPGVIAPLS
jgi:hypothetical protein